MCSSDLASITIRKMRQETGISHKSIGRAKGWFLTYPHCPVEKEIALGVYKARFGESLVDWVVAEEKHKDGSPHLHAFVQFDKKTTVYGDTFDLQAFHGEYQPAKSWQCVIRYCTKDGNYISKNNVEAGIRKQNKHLTVEDFSSDPLDLLEQGKLNPLSLNNFLRNRETYRSLLARKVHRQDNSPLKKKRHEWLYGPSNTGKSTILKEEMAGEEDNWFQIPPNNDWTGYYNQEHLYYDEYTGQLKMSELNRICDGGAKVNTKGSTVTLAKDVIVHIVSNYSMEECYSEQKDLSTLKNRFIENKLIKIFN